VAHPLAGNAQATIDKYGNIATGTINDTLEASQCANPAPLAPSWCGTGSDLAPISQAQLDQVALRLNQRPRKTLGFQTPASRL
jgi:hypothetical protein